MAMKIDKDKMTADLNMSLKLPPGPNLNLLLIGEIGGGKSATGNSILGRRAFKSYGGGSIVTQITQAENAVVDNRVITVVEFSDYDRRYRLSTCLSHDFVEDIKKELRKFSEEEFSAILLVLPYGIRTTKERIENIQKIRTIFGENVFKNQTVCVITHGDLFKDEYYDDDTKIKERCCGKDRTLAELIEECGNRCVLFDNITRDKVEKKLQLLRLVSAVDGLRKHNQRCTTQEILSAGLKRVSLHHESFDHESDIEDCHVECCSINIDLQRVMQDIETCHPYYLQRLRQRIERLRKRLGDNSNARCLEMHIELDRISLTIFKTENRIKQGAIERPKESSKQEKVKRRMISASKKMLPGPYIDLLMVGKTGNGKSSIGNSILGREEFYVHGSWTSVTKECKVGYAEHKGCIIKVVDIPGVGDTDSETCEGQLKLVIDAISKGLSLFPQGFNAMLLVLSYTSRFTEEEVRAVKTLKHILGEDFLRKYTICVFTRGDSFNRDHGHSGDFLKWCERQKLITLNTLFQECCFRCTIFDNVTKDEEVRISQLDRLISVAKNLELEHSRYTFDDFMNAVKERDCMVESLEFNLKIENYSKELGLMKDDMKNIKKSWGEEQENHLHSLIARIERMNRDLETQEKVTLYSTTEFSVPVKFILYVLNGLRSFLKQYSKIMSESTTTDMEIEMITSQLTMLKERYKKQQKAFGLDDVTKDTKIKQLEENIKQLSENQREYKAQKQITELEIARVINELENILQGERDRSKFKRLIENSMCIL